MFGDKEILFCSEIMKKLSLHCHLGGSVNLDCKSPKGSFTNYVDKFWLFLTTYPPCVNIFYGINVDKMWTFLDYLPTSSCKRSLCLPTSSCKRSL